MKIKKFVRETARIALLSAYLYSCGGSDGGNNNIKTFRNNDGQQSLENAITGEYYETQIAASDFGDGTNALEFFLEDKPEGMTINKDTGVIKWSPRYSTIGPKYSQVGNFNIKVSVNDGTESVVKDLNLYVEDNLNANYANFMRTNKDIRVICGDNIYLCPFNESYLDLKFIGVSNGVEKLKNVTNVDVKTTGLEPMKPVHVRFTENVIGDSSCQQQTGEWGHAKLTDEGIYARHGLICIFRPLDANGNGFISPGSSPDDLYDQLIEVHEYVHEVFWWRTPKSFDPDASKFDESFAYIISRIVTGCESPFLPKSTAPPQTSFCDSWDSRYPLTKYLCDYYGFNITDVDAMISGIDQKIAELGWGFLPIRNVKCVIDDIVKQATDNAFLDSTIYDIGYCGN